MKPSARPHLQLLERDVTDERQREHARRHSELMQRSMLTCGPSASTPPTWELRELAAIVEAQWHGLVVQRAMAGRGRLDAWLRAGLLRFLRSVIQGADVCLHQPAANPGANGTKHRPDTLG